MGLVLSGILMFQEVVWCVVSSAMTPPWSQMAFALCAKMDSNEHLLVEWRRRRRWCNLTLISWYVSHFCEHVVSKGTIFSSLNIDVQEQMMHPCVTMYTEKQSIQILIWCEIKTPLSRQVLSAVHFNKHKGPIPSANGAVSRLNLTHTTPLPKQSIQLKRNPVSCKPVSADYNNARTAVFIPFIQDTLNQKLSAI